ncbi:hypothetical protein V2J09_013876 [Rumex salicifolius]
MNRSSNNRFDVFEFNQEDEIVGKIDAKRQSRFQNPKFDGSPNLKYDFLARVAQGSDINPTKSVAVECVDIDSVDEDGHCSSKVAMQTLTISMEDSRPLLGCNDAMDSAFEPNCQIDENMYVHRSSNSDMDGEVSSPEGHILENSNAGSPLTDSPIDSGSFNSTKSTPVLSKKDGSISSPDACEDSCAELHTFKGLDMDEVDCVVVHADYVIFNGNYYPASQMTFSDHSIKMECSFVDKDVENCMYEWAIDEDVVSIQSQACTRASVVNVQIHVLSKSTVKTENMHNASGIQELKVTLFDPEWLLSLEKIKSLNMKYQAAWEVLAPLEMVDDFPASKSQLSQKPYFPVFDEQFEEVIYPEGDVDAVSISKRDVDLLNPETFVNDTIIDFYIKYLKNEIPAGERNRFHFFNSFFFRKLADLDKNPDSAFDGKAAFQRVRKWTRKVNFFEKDYVFIPVNYNLHWSLIVLCHPGRVADIIDEKLNESSRVPCILHMDSIRGSHTGLKKLIQSYLLEEWKERQKGAFEDISSKFLNLRYLSLELTADWFIPGDVSLKRPYIQRLIREILVSRSQGNNLSNKKNDSVEDIPQPAKLEEDNGNLKGIELISVSCNLQNTCTPDSLYSGTLQGIDMNLQVGSPDRSSDCPSQPSLGFRDLFEPGTSSGMLFGQRYDLGSYEQPRGMSPIQEEEDEDNTDHLYSMQNGSSLRQLDEFTPDDCSIQPFRTASWDQSFNLEDNDKEVDDSSLDSHYDSDDDEVKVIEADNSQKLDALSSPHYEKPDQPNCHLFGNQDTGSFVSAASEIMAIPAEHSQEYLNGNKPDNHVFYAEENDHQLSPKDHEDQAVADEELIIKNSSSDSDEMQPAKRLKLTLGGESGQEMDGLENSPLI